MAQLKLHLREANLIILSPRGEANLWINSELSSIWTEKGFCRLVIRDPPEGIKAMLKLAADNNLEIKLATTWENQRIGPVKIE